MEEALKSNLLPNFFLDARFKPAVIDLVNALKILILGKNAKLVMQVHDEVIVETTNEDLEEVIRVIKICMCTAPPGFTAPLAVKISTGHSWGELREFCLSGQTVCS